MSLHAAANNQIQPHNTDTDVKRLDMAGV